jgi:hypothetical protein
MIVKRFVIALGIALLMALPNLCFAVLYGTATSDYPNVVKISDSENSFLATGTIIADGWVLTSGVVAQSISSGSTFYFGTTSYTVDNSYVNPSFNIYNNPYAYNIGLLKVSGLSQTSYPALLNRGFASTEIGSNITFVGYGLDEYGNFGTKLMGVSPLNSIYAGGFSTYGIGKAAGSSGDSGAPAFFNYGNSWYLAGVLSGTDTDGLGETYFSSFDQIDTRNFLNETIASQVPLPPAIILLGSGLIGLMGLRKRFKK